MATTSPLAAVSSAQNGTFSIKRARTNPLFQRIEEALNQEPYPSNLRLIELFQEAMKVNDLVQAKRLISKINHGELGRDCVTTLMITAEIGNVEIAREICAVFQKNHPQEFIQDFANMRFTPTQNYESQKDFLLSDLEVAPFHIYQSFLSMEFTIEDRFGETALIAATKKGYLTFMRFLVEELGADPNFQDQFGYTALQHAIFLKQLPGIALYLIEKGCVVSLVDCNLQFPIDLAIDLDRLVVAEALIQPSIDQGVPKDVLLNAAENAFTKGFKELGEKIKIEAEKIEPIIQDFRLDFSVLADCLKKRMVLSLDSREVAHLNRDLQQRASSLVQKGYDRDFLQELMEAFFPGIVPDNKHLIKLFSEAVEKQETYAQKFLVQRIRHDDLGDGGTTCLMVAAKTGNVELAKLIIKVFKEQRMFFDSCQEALHKSVTTFVNIRKIPGLGFKTQGSIEGDDEYWKSYRFPDLLSERIEEDEILGRTALMIAAENGKLNFVKFLVDELEAALDFQDIHGFSSLQAAIGKSEEDVASYLIQKGCDVTYQDKSGLMPLEYAMKRNLKQLALDLVKATIEQEYKREFDLSDELLEIVKEAEKSGMKEIAKSLKQKYAFSEEQLAELEVFSEEQLAELEI